ncbi:hypothetical protein [Phaeobacter sp. J2-8]|uniref:hypothetical protein n=1 Tax=Phaeobacter sp. J2-8 TaxID=2931394 RepID=UPI001FD2956C|nr:hypothetical protein [Phaeobacter sp. J2-8]MCJ7872208.1 hypothetical protein [Phaeobacter sp. J2-8]
MVQTNKILTVSYGTFSCTLEGFDDSFETMKAIAEYFRDLASDDRYFGAEPPTPDAEMLARIAEREISRRVEARVSDDGIVLRPSLAAVDQPSAPVADSVPPTEVAPMAQAPEVETPEEQAPVAKEPEVSETADPAGDTLGVAADVAETMVQDLVAEQDDTAADAVVEDAVVDTMPQVDQPETVDHDAELTAAALGLSDTIDRDVAEDLDEDMSEPTPDPVIPAVSDSMAEKLARIRAVVAPRMAQEPRETAPVETVDVQPDPTLDNIMSTLSSGDADDDLAVTDTVAVDADVLDEVAVDDVAAEDAAADTKPQKQVFEGRFDGGDIDEDDDEDDLLEDNDLDVAESVSAEEPVLAAPQIDTPEDTATPEVETPAQFVAPVVEDTAPDTAPEPARPQRIAPRRPVRVVKVRRALKDTVKPKPPVETSLTPEDEADLVAELAKVEAELQTAATPAQDDVKAAVADQLSAEVETEAEDQALSEDTAADIAAVVEDTTRAVRAMARRERRDNFAEDEGDVSRLMAATNEQLREPEGQSRRNAIAHLRAAVAATRADRSGDVKAESDPRDAYRNDLAQAVRPRRTAGDEDHDRPRAAPLKLVAEQRVDLVDAKQKTAARADESPRPHQAAPAVDETTDATDGFAAFAEAAGATGLPDLLEAAAAYMSFVEGRDEFSRPQLMTKVRQVEGSDSSREDRLRGFGQLLREGKIEKVQGGRFTASESIGFRPNKRAVG